MKEWRVTAGGVDLGLYVAPSAQGALRLAEQAGKIIVEERKATARIAAEIKAQIRSEDKARWGELKRAALADREAAIKADDALAQRAAEAEYNAVLDIEARQRSQDATRARVKAEEKAREDGYAAAEAGVGPDGVRRVAKNLRKHWTEGWNAYWNSR